MKKYSLFIFLCFFLATRYQGAAQQAWALPVHWQVRTQVHFPVTGKNATLEWNFEQTSQSGDQIEVKAQEDHLGLGADLRFKASGTTNGTFQSLPRLIAARVQFPGQGKDSQDQVVGSRVFVQDTPALSLHKTMPLDWLNMDLPCQSFEKKFRVVEQVAGFSFARQVKVRAKQVTLSDLRQQGYVSPALGQASALPDQALWVDVLQLSGPGQGTVEEKVLFSQVWIKGCPFWIYEQTPFRQSWLESYSTFQTSK